MTSRQLVKDTLAGKNIGGRAPRQMWLLPWAWMHHAGPLDDIRRDYPDDIVNIGAATKPSPQVSGDPHAVGEYIDDFGCMFTNRQAGVIGEVKKPLVLDDEWEDADSVHIPEEWLSFDVAEANENILKYGEDKFCIAGHCPRPFERLQFIRGTENLYMDLMCLPPKLMGFIEKLHDFYCRLLKKWAKTNVDALSIMDDWGSQNALLINPKLWDKIFQPMYRDYIDIAHSAGKKIFMHSDGYTLDVIPRLIDLGLDAINSQLFCMGLDKLKQYRGKITFWGEIDRQQLLPNASIEQIGDAVKKVYDTLWDNGGCIAQCEFGPGARPENVREVYRKWDELTAR